jgi:hypothetical protein
VAVADVYPTEQDARRALETDLAPGVPLGRYRGLWHLPVSYGLVHLFTDAEERWLIDSGWAPEPTNEDGSTGNDGYQLDGERS